MSGYTPTNEDLKLLINKVLQDQITISETELCAAQLGIDISAYDFLNQKRRVLREALVRLLRQRDADNAGELDDEEVTRFRTILSETEAWLNLPKTSGFPCSKVGCSFVGESHREYLNHLSNSHFFGSKDFLCNFRNKCLQRFKTIDQLKQHVCDVHRKAGEQGLQRHVEGEGLGGGGDRGPNIAQPIQCKLLSCGRKIFPNLKKFMTHYSNDHHEIRSCIFSECPKNLKPENNIRKHFYDQHTKKGQTRLKPGYYVNEPTQADVGTASQDDMEVDPNTDVEVTDETTEEQNEDDRQLDEEHLEAENGHDIVKMFCDFYNRLSFIYMVAQSTITMIVKEIHSMMLRSRENQKLKVKKVLMNENVSAGCLHRIMNILDNDPNILAHEALNSEHKREKFLHDNFNVVHPREIILNPEEIKTGAKKECYQYLPLKPALRMLLEDRSFNETMDESRNRMIENGVYREFKDGKFYKSLDYFKRNPGALAGGIYSDCIELKNPLGSARGKYKLLELFWFILDLNKEMRSKVDRIQVGIVCQEKILRKYGYKVIYSPLIKDMKEVETIGIKLTYPVERIQKISFCLHLGDNLESNGVGGFQMNFSRGYFCRFCHIKHDQLNDCIHDFTAEGPHRYWTETEYDSIVTRFDQDSDDSNEALTSEQIEEQLLNEEDTDDEDSAEDEGPNDVGEEESDEDDEQENHDNNFGLKSRCVFNCLTNFHACKSLPPDCMHDFMEGIIPSDLLSAIKILVRKGYFNEAGYNDGIKRLSMGSSDRPEPVSVKSTVNRLKGKALSNLCHLRYFGIIVRSIVRDHKILEEKIFRSMIWLARILEKIMAPEIRDHEVDDLESDIIEYLDVRQELFEEYPDQMTNPKPKAHFVSHYGQAIRNFGPPTVTWTARCESKNAIAKQLAHSAKNTINISRTVALRQSYRQASVYYHGMYPVKSDKIVPPKNAKRKFELTGEKSDLMTRVISLMEEETLFCDNVEHEGVRYRNEDVIVLCVNNSTSLSVGLILGILIKENEVLFLVNKYNADRNNDFGYYESVLNDENLSITKASDLADYKPLFKIGTRRKFIFPLHHFLTSSATVIDSICNT